MPAPITDREIAARLGHTNVSVEPLTDAILITCACGWNTKRQNSDAALEAAVYHVRSAAERFRVEAYNAGKSITEALDTWNGLVRQPHNGVLSGSPRRRS